MNLNEVTGASIIFPNNAKDAIDVLSAETAQLHKDIVEQKKAAPNDFLRLWVDFYRQVRDFSKAHSGLLNRLNAASVYEKATSFRRSLVNWKQQFQDFGGNPSPVMTPMHVEPKAGIDVMKWIKIGSALFGVYWIWQRMNEKADETVQLITPGETVEETEE